MIYLHYIMIIVPVEAEQCMQ